MASIWKEAAPPRQYPPLAGDCKREAVVIGGGMAGVLIARLLREAGVDVLLLEARRIGSGQTGNTAAKVTAQQGDRLGKLLSGLGEEKAGQYAAAQCDAVRGYEELIRRAGIACHWELLPAWFTAASEEAVRQELEAEQALGLSPRLLIGEGLPFSAAAGLELPGQGQFQPLEFLYAAAEGLSVCEETPVTQVTEDTVVTPGGAVRADHIIFADHYPFPKTPGYYFLRMRQERSYILALEGAAAPPAMVYHLEEGGGVLSLRTFQGRLLLGGGGHVTGENREGGRYRALEERAAVLWPGARPVARWSAQDCIPLDEVPYIGPFAPSRPRWLVATGFGKWGMTNSMVAARIIRGEITGERPPWAEVFSPQRFRLSASAANLAENTAQAMKGLGRRLLAPPRDLVENLPAGHGGIVEADGDKVGVYRDEAGEPYFVDPHCPHLGCQLEWNPDEKSWDCPCHGSRFDHRGRLLDGPAQKGLETI